jgi:hypothetical protein
MIRTDSAAVKVWTAGLSAEMADCTAALLRAWLPSGITGAWAEPDWEGTAVTTDTKLAKPTAAAKDSVAA